MKFDKLKKDAEEAKRLQTFMENNERLFQKIRKDFIHLGLSEEVFEIIWNFDYTSSAGELVEVIEKVCPYTFECLNEEGLKVSNLDYEDEVRKYSINLLSIAIKILEANSVIRTYLSSTAVLEAQAKQLDIEGLFGIHPNSKN